MTFPKDFNVSYSSKYFFHYPVLPFSSSFNPRIPVPICRVVGPMSAPYRAWLLGEAGHGKLMKLTPYHHWAGVGLCVRPGQCSGDGNAQSKVWDGQSWLGVPGPVMRLGPSASQALWHSSTTGC